MALNYIDLILAQLHTHCGQASHLGLALDGLIYKCYG